MNPSNRPAVAVVGGGRMGAGIAQVFAAAGYPVVVSESGPDAAAAALQRVRTGLRHAAERNVLNGTVDEVAARVSVVTAIGQLPADAALLVEAVPEDPALKRSVLTQAAQVVAASCVLATNTSSLSVDDLGRGLPDPTRFLGMHFFNPVPASTLVEIVRGAHTTHAVIAQVGGWVTELGKQSVVVRNSPGFATSRLGVLLGLEAIRMLEEGVTDADSIDRAMELGYRHPMGPLRSTDLVGLDVRLAIADHVTSTLGDRFTAPQLLRDKVARGELGRKTGQGFYTWS